MNGTDPFFQRTELLLGRQACTALARTSVIIFGTGGVGGWCAEALVRTGIGRLTLVDPDRVAASNINRQLPATARTIGESKVDVLKQRFQDIHPQAELTALPVRYTADTADTFALGTYDYVIDAIDSLADKAHLIRHALSFPNLTLFSSMGAARRRDPFRIRHSEFWRVSGDGLARALRQRFRASGQFPPRKFTCVWSDEPPKTDATCPTSRAGGSVVHVTAMFGLALAGLVTDHVCARADELNP